jgi:DNA-binding HxlR family transcriptional regulator
MSSAVSRFRLACAKQPLRTWHVLSGKWTIHILCEMLRGPVRLSQLKRIVPEASKKALTSKLRSLERSQLIVRRDLSGKVLHVQYELAETVRVHLLDLLNGLIGIETIITTHIGSPAESESNS